MPKRIAIFCDGTWNRADARHPTNVVKLSQALDLGAEGTPQQAFYIQGVGSGSGTGKLSRFIDRIGGGAFGWGLTENIEDAYRHLVFNYRPGDQIYIFGFSRGAYTARSLAGLIRSCSIPPSTDPGLIPKAIEHYRRRENHPDKPRNFEFRLKINPGLVTSEKEAAWRAENGHPEGLKLTIAYLGVWDTVGALGLPMHFGLIAKLWNQRYSFHDANLSSSVLSARHAVAIDERRRTFKPTNWDNVETLNNGATGDDRDYRQEWFPGDHGSVGGGGNMVTLSNIALRWVAEGASRKGLRFDAAKLDELAAEQDVLGPEHNHKPPRGGIFETVSRLVPFNRVLKDYELRQPVTDIIAAPTRTRWCRSRSDGKPYAPPTLDPVASALDGLCGNDGG